MKSTKMDNAGAKLLYGSLSLLFGVVLVAVTLVVS